MTRLLDPTLDVVFKLLFVQPDGKDCLLSLLNAVLRLPCAIDDVTVRNPEVPRLVSDKGIVLDILVSLADGRQIDVEMQADKRPGFRKRALLYWARMYASQISPGSEYTELRPATVVVFTGYRESSADRLHSVFQVLDTEDHERFTDDLAIHLVELPKLKSISAEERKREDALVRWVRFMTAQTAEELEELAMTDQAIDKAKGILQRLSADPDARELARQRELGQHFYQYDMAESRKEGRAEGLAEGWAKAELVTARRMLRVALAGRGFQQSPEQEARIDGCTDPDQLSQWLQLALGASSVDEVLG